MDERGPYTPVGPPDEGRPQEPSAEDQHLSRALRAAGDAVTPHEGLTAIRAKIAAGADRPPAQVVPLRRSWRGAVLAAGAVAATVVAAFVVVGTVSEDSAPPPPTATELTTLSTTDPAVPVYYALVEPPLKPATPTGNQADVPQQDNEPLPLAREFHHDPASNRMQAAVRELSSTPRDPDYRTFVPGGMLHSAEVVDGTVEVQLTDDAWTQPRRELSTEEAATAGLQIVYTVRAAAGQGRLPVRFTTMTTPSPAAGTAVRSVHSTLLGIPVGDLLERSDKTSLAPINLTSPAQGDLVSGDTLDLVGRGSGLTRGWDWTITAADGGPGLSGHVRVPGASPKGIDEISTRVDLSELAPGDYVVSVTVRGPKAQPAAGAAGLPDSREFTIR